MKLVFCAHCHDVRGLSKRKRKCGCGKSFGYYQDDGLNAVIGGQAIPLGFANHTFIDALKNRPTNGSGARFEAFVIPVECPTVEDQG